MEKKEMEVLPMDTYDDFNRNAQILVLGVGGGGSNAVNSMMDDKSDQVEYWVANTDSLALQHSRCPNKFPIGKNVTRGLGAGGDPERGRQAAEDSLEEIHNLLEGHDMVILTVGEGGGTGTGAAPVIAKEAKAMGALVLAIVTSPFNFEERHRARTALEGINNLKREVDALMIIKNDNVLFENGGLTLPEAFHAADHVLGQAVKTLTDLILIPGLINLDFADVVSTLKDKGMAMIGIGCASGENRAINAADQAINSPYLEDKIYGANTMLVNITLSPDITLKEVNEAINYIRDKANPEKAERDTKMTIGAIIDPEKKDEITISIIATEFVDREDNASNAPLRSVSAEPTKEEKVEVKPAPQVSKDGGFLPDYLRRRMGAPAPTPTKVEEPIAPAVSTPEVEEEVEEEPLEDEPILKAPFRMK